MPRRGKGAWLGGCQEFSIEQHLLFLTIFLQLCSGQLDSPPHLKRNHPARETSASPIIKEVPNFKRACKRQNKFLASNVDQTAFPIVLDHHCNKDQIKRRMAHHYLSLSPWWAINCLARVPGEDREVNITEYFGLVHHWQQKVNRCSGIEHNAGTTWRNSSLAKPHSISGIEARTTFR